MCTFLELNTDELRPSVILVSSTLSKSYSHLNPIQFMPDDWHMVLVGHRNEKIETNDRVTILPPQHPGDWLSVASCFLSTSTTDGFGLSVAEALAAGVQSA